MKTTNMAVAKAENTVEQTSMSAQSSLMAFSHGVLSWRAVRLASMSYSNGRDARQRPAWAGDLPLPEESRNGCFLGLLRALPVARQSFLQRFRVQLEEMVVVIVEVDRAPLAFDALASLPHVQPHSADTRKAGIVAGVVDLEGNVIVGAAGQQLTFHHGDPHRRSGRIAPWRARRWPHRCRRPLGGSRTSVRRRSIRSRSRTMNVM